MYGKKLHTVCLSPVLWMRESRIRETMSFSHSLAVTKIFSLLGQLPLTTSPQQHAPMSHHKLDALETKSKASL